MPSYGDLMTSAVLSRVLSEVIKPITSLNTDLPCYSHPKPLPLKSHRCQDKPDAGASYTRPRHGHSEFIPRINVG